MTISNPTLTLTFLGGDVSVSTITVTNDDIVKGSITHTFQLFSSLKSSSRQYKLTLKRKSKAVESIIRTEGDIKAVLKDEGDILFSGYLSANYSWTLSDSGEQNLSITIEDNGSKLLGKPFIKTGKHLFKCTAYNAVTAICEKVGIELSSSAPVISTEIVKVVSEGDTCKDILSTMLYELGYVYFFDNNGKMNLFSFLSLPSTETHVFDGTSLIINGSKAVTLSKKVRQYKSAKVKYTELGKAENYLVYRNTTGQDASHKYCNLSLKPNEAFDGAEIYTIDPTVTRAATLTEAVNAESETDIVGSKDIIAVENVSSQIEKNSNISASITGVGGPYLKIEAENRSSNTYAITRLDAYADVVYEKAQGVVISGDDSDSSDNTLEEELSYIHDKDLVEIHANLLTSYYKYSGATYTFYSREDIDCGEVVKINDDVFTGLSVFVLIYAKTLTDSTGVVEYKAVGYSEFQLDKTTVIQRQLFSPVKDMGAKGKKGDSGEKGETGATGADGTNVTVADYGGYRATLSTLKGIEGKVNDSWTLRSNFTGKVGDVLLMKCVITDQNNATCYIPCTITSFNGKVVYGTNGSLIYGPKGDTGEKGNSITTAIEYLLSTSSSLTEEEQAALTGWVDSATLSWSYGYYIYKRIKKTVVETGAVTYTYQGRDTSLEEYYKKQLSFSISSDTATYYKDSRANDSDMTTISMRVSERYYSPSSINWTLNGSGFTPAEDDGLYTFKVPKKNPLQSYTVMATPVKNGVVISGVSSFLTFNSVDTTESYKFFGVVSTLSNVGEGEVLLDGDSCFLNQNDGTAQGNRIYVYQSGSWVEFNSSTVSDDIKNEILAKAQKAAFEYAEDNELSTDYGYFQTLVAKYIYARNIGVEDLRITDGGVIRSGGYNADGTNPTGKGGIYISSDGTVKMEDADVSGSFSNSKINANEIQTILWSKAFPFLYQDGERNSIDELYSKPAFIKTVFPSLVGNSTDMFIHTKALFHTNTYAYPIFVYNASGSVITAITAGVYLKYGYANKVLYNGAYYNDVYIIVVSKSAIDESSLKSLSYFTNTTFYFDTSPIISNFGDGGVISAPDNRGVNRVAESVLYAPKSFYSVGVHADSLPCILVEDVIYECTESFVLKALDLSTVGRDSPYVEEVTSDKTLGKYVRLSKKDGILYYQFSTDKTTWTNLNDSFYFSSITVAANSSTATITGKFNFLQLASAEIRDLRKANNVFDETGKLTVYSLYSYRLYAHTMRVATEIFTNYLQTTMANIARLTVQEVLADIMRTNTIMPLIADGSNIGSNTNKFENIYAKTFNGNATSATTATHATTSGDGTVKIYGEINNEVNFGGSNSSDTIYFGYRAKDSRAIPSTFVFGGSSGTATIKAGAVWGAVAN